MVSGESVVILKASTESPRDERMTRCRQVPRT